MTHRAVQLLFASEFIGLSRQTHTFMHINSMQELIHTETEAIVSNGIHN